MHLSLLTAVFAFWLLVNASGSSDLKDAVRKKRENSRDKDLAASCLWLCDCFRKLQKGHVHIVVVCQQMLQFPSITPKHTTVLRLNDNFIGEITEMSLQIDSLRSLEALECTNCRITAVDVNAFRHLHKLKTIDLRDNSIAHLSSAHFHHQKNLVVLLLKGNSDLDCVPLKVLETRTDNPAKVDCDEIGGTQADVTDKSSETTKEIRDVTKPGIVTDKKTDKTTENSEVRETTATAGSSLAAGSSDAKENVEDLTESRETDDDADQTDPRTSTDAPETKRENEFVVIGSIVGTVIAAVIAAVIGVTGIVMLCQAGDQAK